MNVKSIADDLQLSTSTLEDETSILSGQFRATKFFGHSRNLPNVHNGYLMACMGKIDLLSTCWAGSIHVSQTQRMNDFMCHYLDPTKADVHKVAVKLFRHTLMHTGELRFLYAKTTGVAYTWRVFFTALATSIQHYSLTDEDVTYQDTIAPLVANEAHGLVKVKALNVEIPKLAKDIRVAADTYVKDLLTTNVLANKCVSVYPNILVQKAPM